MSVVVIKNDDGSKLYCLVTEARRLHTKLLNYTICPRPLRNVAQSIHDSNPRPVNRNSDALSIATPCHLGRVAIQDRSRDRSRQLRL